MEAEKDVRTFERFPGVVWKGDTGDFVTIEEEKCDGCGNCIRVCPARVFGMRKKKAIIKSLENCIECTACYFVCSPDAIDFHWPKGGTGYRSDWG
jgi:NAD-dependent dihydropyrimidine dehydrogenase PreA subunit